MSGAEAEIEPLTQDPSLLQNTLSQIPIPNLPETIHLQLPPFEQALTYGYKDGLQASPDLARTIQVREKILSSYFGDIFSTSKMSRLCGTFLY